MINNTTKSLAALSIIPYFGNIIRFVKARENNFDFNKIIISPSKYIKYFVSASREYRDFLNQRKYLEYLDKVSK